MYKSRTVQVYLDFMDKSPPKITVLDAVTWITVAWDDIKSQTIENCSRKAEIKRADDADEVRLKIVKWYTTVIISSTNLKIFFQDASDDDFLDTTDDDILRTMLQDIGVNFDNYVAVDDDLLTSEI